MSGPPNMANARQEISGETSPERTLEDGAARKEADAEVEKSPERPSLPQRLWEKTGLNIGLLCLMTKFVAILILKIWPDNEQGSIASYHSYRNVRDTAYAFLLVLELRPS